MISRIAQDHVVPVDKRWSEPGPPCLKEIWLDIMTRWAGMSCLTHVWHCMTLGCYRHRMTNDISTFRYLRWTTYQAWHASNMLTSLCQVKASCLWVPVLRLAGFMRCHLLKKNIQPAIAMNNQHWWPLKLIFMTLTHGRCIGFLLATGCVTEDTPQI